ncbi:hypothetical protein [Leisingera sp. S232]|uniref:hypothetical protein n=1 Tax=Leisingera sp. S232 TaxID=3415132 RepID=UPI003C7DF35D
MKAKVRVLNAEIALLTQLPKDITLSRLLWGGGTPTLLSAELIRDLVAAITKAEPRALRAEFSVEIDPNEIGDWRLHALASSTHIRTIRDRHFATPHGHALGGKDLLRARLIEALMCDFRICRTEILSQFAISADQLERMFQEVSAAFPGMLQISAQGLDICREALPLAQMIARNFDAYDLSCFDRRTAF